MPLFAPTPMFFKALKRDSSDVFLPSLPWASQSLKMQVSKAAPHPIYIHCFRDAGNQIKTFSQAALHTGSRRGLGTHPKLRTYLGLREPTAKSTVHTSRPTQVVFFDADQQGGEKSPGSRSSSAKAAAATLGELGSCGRHKPRKAQQLLAWEVGSFGLNQSNKQGKKGWRSETACQSYQVYKFAGSI